MKTLRLFLGVFFIILFFSNAHAQLLINNTGMNAVQIVQNAFGSGSVSVSNITYSGYYQALGEFSTGNNPTNLGLQSGIILSTGKAVDAAGPNTSGSTSSTNGTGSDSALALLVPGYTINDAASLKFTITPSQNYIHINYVFASEEYPEWVGSSFNDVFGIFLTGPKPGGGTYNSQNIAIIPGTTLPVSIDNVNANTYSQYYVNNIADSLISFDGLTTVFTTWAHVIPNTQYNIKIAIGDAGDSSYDSAIFFEDGSPYFLVSNNGPLCAGDSLILFANNLDSSLSYFWTGPNGFESTQQNPVIANSSIFDSGNYLMFLVDSTDTTFYASTYVEVHPLDFIDLGADVEVCDNVSVILNAGGGFASYLWNTGASTQQIMASSTTMGIGTHPYWVTAYNSSGCAVQDTVLVTFMDCTGMDEFSLTPLEVNPNPSSERIYINMPEHTRKAELYDINGKLLIQITPQSPVLEINISGLQAGLYFVKLYTGSGMVNTKFVKE